MRMPLNSGISLDSITGKLVFPMQEPLALHLQASRYPQFPKTLKWLFFKNYRNASSFGLLGRSGYHRLPLLKRNACISKRDYPSKWLDIRKSQWHGNAMRQDELLEPGEELVFSFQRVF